MLSKNSIDREDFAFLPKEYLNNVQDKDKQYTLTLFISAFLPLTRIVVYGLKFRIAFSSYNYLSQ